ncbi:MAG: ribbon-helix-helix domain-containing protein [Xanthobacteraceae bacterium]|nr:ribbon-helix-helix domain-containing protein [Xanthobacteraceae bacterium]
MGTTERLVVDLPSDLVEGLRESVKAGAFSSESEAIEVLLRSWYGPDEVAERDIVTLRAFVAKGIAETDAGHVIDADQVHVELRTRIKAITDRRG